MFLAESGYFMPFPRGLYHEALGTVLREAHKKFLEWKRARKLQCSQPRFTWSRLLRKTRMMYPCLSSKAVASKVVSHWLCDCAMEFAQRPGADRTSRLVATCLRAYTSTLEVMESAPMVMSQVQAQQYYRGCMVHLQTYAALHGISRTCTGKAPNRTMWLLITKHHHLYEHAKVTLRERWNPACTQLLCAEDWIGRLGRISRACHRSAVSKRTMQRYLATLHLELSRL